MALVLILFSILGSEDAACVAAGSLAASGLVSPLFALLSAATGILVGDLLLLAVGYGFGAVLLEGRLARKWISSQDLTRARGWLDSHGCLIIFVARFTPGLRVPAYFLVGATRPSFMRSALLLAAATTVWTPLIVGASYWLGGRFLAAGLGTFRLAPLLLLLVLLLAAWSVRLLAAHRSAQAFFLRVGKLCHWEFWPVWLAYVPVFPYIVCLTLRFRGPVFTAANPGLSHGGGLVGESKHEVLAPIAARGGPVAPFTLLQAPHSFERRLEQVLSFSEKVGFPLVMKPDVGQRGFGVAICRSRRDVERYLRSHGADTIAQQFVGGREFGLFYYRYPEQERGQIFSITDKRFPEIVGDGKRTFEQLVRCDPRAVHLAATYLRQSRHPVDRVVAAGERVSLTEVGNHCLGTIFLNGSSHATEALRVSVDRVARMVPGFFYGRLDVRTESEEALRAGHFTVLELNGVSSEATHIYDPEVSMADAYRTLWKQWQLAFRIGEANRRRGAHSLSFKTLMGMGWDFLLGRVVRSATGASLEIRPTAGWDHDRAAAERS